MAGDSARELDRRGRRGHAAEPGEATGRGRRGIPVRGRPEQADRELAEKAILEAYLPAGLDEAEIAAIVDSVLAAGGFTEPAQTGQAMKAVMAEIAGRADGKVVSALVKARLVALTAAARFNV